MTPPAAHQAAPLPPYEALRLQALQSYSILDTAVEAAFDDIARLASLICQTPIALISLVDAERQWFKAEVGLGIRETPRDESVCAHAILEPGVFVVPDTLSDSRFASSPLVRGAPEMRFYAGAPIVTPDGFALGTVCVLDLKPRDLTEDQRNALVALSRQTLALMTLHNSLRDAEAMQKHLRQVMAVAGHDLRQPLQTISLALEVAHRKATEPLVVKSVGLGQIAVKKLGQQLDDLAFASNPLVGALLPERIKVSVASVFQTLVTAWQPLAEFKGVELRVAPTSLEIVSDPKLLGTILGNLVGNAIKYTDSGKVLIGCRRLHDQVVIQVLDTGVGIASEFQAEMFEPFRKADPGTPGLGLGLSIVRKTADLLGHELRLDSTPGRGTVVKLIAPRPV